MGCPKLHEGWRFVSAETAEYAYSPYGALAKSSGPDKNACPFLFSSEYLDSETNLVYYNYRYYPPELGRWTKRDSIEEEGGFNLYATVNNDPINYYDMKGLEFYKLGYEEVTYYKYKIKEPADKNEAKLVSYTSWKYSDTITVTSVDSHSNMFSVSGSIVGSYHSLGGTSNFSFTKTISHSQTYSVAKGKAIDISSDYEIKKNIIPVKVFPTKWMTYKLITTASETCEEKGMVELGIMYNYGAMKACSAIKCGDPSDVRKLSNKYYLSYTDGKILDYFLYKNGEKISTGTDNANSLFSQAKEDYKISVASTIQALKNGAL